METLGIPQLWQGLHGTKLGVFGGFLTLKASGAEIRRLWVFGFRVWGVRAFEFQSVFRQRVLKASGASGSFQGSILSIQASAECKRFRFLGLRSTPLHL